MTRPIASKVPRVVLMNDTSLRQHHGCARVMRLLEAGLRTAGLQITARSPAHADWAQDKDFLRHLSEADLVVINGEGTLHHGREGGKRLLEVVAHPARGTTPVALINALYQDNPADWAKLLGGCALVSARDPESAREIAAACPGVALRHVPDLSLCAGAAPQPGPRCKLIVGDAVRIGTRRALALAARRLGADQILPTKTRHGHFWRMPIVGAALRRIVGAGYSGVSPFGRGAAMTLARDEAAYLASLGQASLHLTGRFHAVCLSLVTGTPFLAVGSNSWKIEALLDDAGLGRDRIVTVDDLASMTSTDTERPFSKAETDCIVAFLARAHQQAVELFSDLAKLAAQARG